jgi:hypothetical protein
MTTTPTKVRRLATTATALTVALAVPATAWAAPALPGDPPVDPGTPVVLDTDAHARFDWSMPERYDRSWAAYQTSTGTYKSAFVNPTRWSLSLNACASTSVHAITGYAFTITQAGTGSKTTITSKSCKTQVDTLPSLGAYDVGLTLVTDWGANKGVSVPTNRPVVLDDILVVSMGDSLASGEGNPDTRGEYFAGTEIVPAQWKEERCHRSALSGPALAAKAIEKADPKTSVTFVSVACSGAKVAELYRKSYGGIVPRAGFEFPAQVTQVARVIGPLSPRGGRQIDALLVSAGVNDLYFSNLVARCAKPWTGTGCVRWQDRRENLAGLPTSYRKLAVAIRDQLPATGKVFVNNYPAHVFKDGACGTLFGLRASKGREIAKVGVELNHVIATTIQRYAKSPFCWTAVGDLDAPFTPHPYCGSSTWFTRYEWSQRHQGDIYGTAHPNGPGQRAFASILKTSIASVLAQV